MKTSLTLTAILIALTSSGAALAKVTYEDAVASNASFYNTHSSTKNTQTRGLDEHEQPSDNISEGVGKWVKTSNPSKDNSSVLNTTTLAEMASVISGDDCAPINSYGRVKTEKKTHIGNGSWETKIITTYYQCKG